MKKGDEIAYLRTAEKEIMWEGANEHIVRVEAMPEPRKRITKSAKKN